jgi:hypothetical protein
MPRTTRTRGLWWSRLHFLIRFLGLTGLLVAIVAVTIAWRNNILHGWQPVWSWPQVETEAGRSWAEIQSTVEKANWDFARILVTVLLSGAALFALALVVELLAGMTVVSGRRSAFGFNAFVQVILAALLLVAINYYSFGHYLRFDWTQNRQFTLPPEISDQLRQLQGETQIVVYQRHKTLGQVADKPDDYDVAAERMVLDKIEDLVDLFREFGPRFRVETLDVAKENFSDRIAAVTHQIAEKSLREQKEDPDYRPNEDEVESKARQLRAAIESTPEDTIFFFGGGKMQALSFNDLVQLDKAASQEQDNLVMLDQGVKPFADKVLNVEGKRPKVGIAVIHPVLATSGREDIGLKGLRNALTARGIDVQDIVLKKWSEFAPPTAATYTIEESKLDIVDENLMIADLNLKNLAKAQKQIEDELQELRKSSLDELTKKYASQLRGRKMTEEIRQALLERDQEELTDIQTETTSQRSRRATVLADKSKLNVDQITEQRRIDDPQGKLARILADCDLLIIPRLTLLDVRPPAAIIPNRVYRIDEGQVNAIKDFIKGGKPVLACFGPANDPPDDRPSLDAMGPDSLEDLFVQLGVRFGKQTVLFDAESESLASVRASPLSASAKLPALEFEWKPGAGLPGLLRTRTPERSNPLHDAMLVAARSLGKDSEGRDWLLDLPLRHPRPIYYEPPDGKTPSFDPTFLMSSPASWNEDQPFPTRERVPHYERPKADDPDRGTVNEKRRGPFPVGIAVTASVPASWQASTKETPVSVRIAVIGHGGLITGAELSPAREKLLLNTVNWLLGRSEYLPTAEKQWTYPRVGLDPRDKQLWHWGTQFALPGFFAWLGLVVLLMRRVR